jgi:hypothetical protein
MGRPLRRWGARGGLLGSGSASRRGGRPSTRVDVGRVEVVVAAWNGQERQSTRAKWLFTPSVHSPFVLQLPLCSRLISFSVQSRLASWLDVNLTVDPATHTRCHLRLIDFSQGIVISGGGCRSLDGNNLHQLAATNIGTPMKLGHEYV